MTWKKKKKENKIVQNGEIKKQFKIAYKTHIYDLDDQICSQKPIICH